MHIFGDYAYPEIIIYSVNLKNYHHWRNENRWDLIAEDLISVAAKLKEAGADFGLIATNTMHHACIPTNTCNHYLLASYSLKILKIHLLFTVNIKGKT